MATSNHDQSCAGLMSMAERELGAFFSVVTDLYGSEEARISANDWLEEFELTDGPPESTGRKCRLITIAAATRLANRITAPPTNRLGDPLDPEA